MSHYAQRQHAAAPQPGEKGYRAPPPSCPYNPSTTAEHMLAAAMGLLHSEAGVALFRQAEQLFDEVRGGNDLGEELGVPDEDCDGADLSEERRIAIALDTVRLAGDVLGHESVGLGSAWQSARGRHASRTIRDKSGQIPRWAALAVIEDFLRGRQRLRLVPVSKKTAARFIEAHHTHRPEPNWRGTMYTLGVMLGDRLVGVASAGTPTGIKPPLAWNTLELTRVATDGTVPNASSMLAARMLRLAEHSRRGDPGDPWLFVTYSELGEDGATYKALKDLGLRPTRLTKASSKGYGRRKGSRKGLGRRIRWEAGPAAGEARWELLEAGVGVPASRVYRKLHALLHRSLGMPGGFGGSLELLRWMEGNSATVHRLLMRRGLARSAHAPAVPFPPPDEVLNSIDMASGVGMLALGFQLEGFRIRELCEFVGNKQLTAEDNVVYRMAELLQSIGHQGRHAGPVRAAPSGCDATEWHPTMPPGGVHVFTGGPPCQPYSRLGSQQGGEDERDLFMEVPRICREVRPTVVVMENVEGTESARFNDYFESWWAAMAAEGYEGVVWKLRAADFGSASLRTRAFFVAWRVGFEGAEVLREPPPATHANPQTKKGQAAIQRGLQPWTRAVDRMNGGCCYGMWSCSWVNNLRGACQTCQDGSNYVEDPATEVRAFPQGPETVDVQQDAAGGWWVEVHDPESFGNAARPEHSLWRLQDGELRRVAEGLPVPDRARVRAQDVPEPVWRALLAAVVSERNHLLPQRSVQRRKVQFRLRPQTLRKQKVIDPDVRFHGELGYYLVPALLHRSFRSMVGTVYTTTPHGDDGIDSLEAASVAQHLRVMDLPVWFGVHEDLQEGRPARNLDELEEAFGALGNGVPLLLGRVVAQRVWQSFGRAPLPELTNAGLWLADDTNPGCVR